MLAFLSSKAALRAPSKRCPFKVHQVSWPNSTQFNKSESNQGPDESQSIALTSVFLALRGVAEEGGATTDGLSKSKGTYPYKVVTNWLYVFIVCWLWLSENAFTRIFIDGSLGLSGPLFLSPFHTPLDLGIPMALSFVRQRTGLIWACSSVARCPDHIAGLGLASKVIPRQMVHKSE